MSVVHESDAEVCGLYKLKLSSYEDGRAETNVDIRSP